MTAAFQTLDGRLRSPETISGSGARRGRVCSSSVCFYNTYKVAVSHSRYPRRVFVNEDYPMFCQSNDSICDGDGYLRLKHKMEPREGEVAHGLYDYREEHFPTTLDFRGWCLEERLLAPRVLHFNNSELAWECTSTTACEYQILSEATDALKRYKLELVNIPLDRSKSDPTVDPAKNRWVWANVFRDFTRGKLTRNTDRLAALAGMAELTKPESADY
jgi:hypothetical protein